ncbi:MAG: polyprenol monophosphomannose synthase [Planctomycetes bacterium]|nr:polyprenol monophosphomannose synthase [Planctomycetota bacterium]
MAPAATQRERTYASSIHRRPLAGYTSLPPGHPGTEPKVSVPLPDASSRPSQPATSGPGPRPASRPLVVVNDFAAAEAQVRGGVDSAELVITNGQDAAAALAAAERGVADGRGPVPVRAHTPPWRTLVVVPTYNEKDNVEPIVRAIHSYLDCDVLVVDDGSPDGTGAIADRLAAADPRVHVLHRQGKQGLGTAYLAGFRFAMERGYQRVCEMDADFSHAPWDLPRLVFASAEHELVIGSRYVKGGCTVGWDFRRRMLSRGANLYARLMLSSGIRDNTAGYRCFHTEALRQLDLSAVGAQGYAFQIEMAFRMVRAGFRVKEIPIHFVDRRVGKSKMDGKIAREALLLVPRLRGRVPKGRANG